MTYYDWSILSIPSTSVFCNSMLSTCLVSEENRDIYLYLVHIKFITPNRVFFPKSGFSNARLLDGKTFFSFFSFSARIWWRWPATTARFVGSIRLNFFHISLFNHGAATGRTPPPQANHRCRRRRCRRRPEAILPPPPRCRLTARRAAAMPPPLPSCQCCHTAAAATAAVAATAAAALLPPPPLRCHCRRRAATANIEAVAFVFVVIVVAFIVVVSVTIAAATFS